MYYFHSLLTQNTSFLQSKYIYQLKSNNNKTKYIMEHPKNNINPKNWTCPNSTRLELEGFGTRLDSNSRCLELDSTRVERRVESSLTMASDSIQLMVSWVQIYDYKL